ncbi:MAG: hypothetical protein U0V75_02705 [Ferruginibacter sp.]
MFRFVKKINSEKDVTINPDILFNLDVATSDIKVHGLKLQDGADLIPLHEVLTTTFEKAPTDALLFPNGVAMRTWSNDKVYYESSDGFKEHPLADRINSVLEFGGILHMKSGAKYAICNRKIIGLGIHQDILSPYKNISKKNIEKKFGKASRVEETYEATDGELWNTTYFYEKRNLLIDFYEPDKQISLINIGAFDNNTDNR